MKIEVTKNMADISIRAVTVCFIGSDGKLSELKRFLSNLTIGFDPQGLSVHVNSGNYVLNNFQLFVEFSIQNANFFLFMASFLLRLFFTQRTGFFFIHDYFQSMNNNLEMKILNFQ